MNRIDVRVPYKQLSVVLHCTYLMHLNCMDIAFDTVTAFVCVLH